MVMHSVRIGTSTKTLQRKYGGSAGSGKLFNNATEDNLINGVTIGLFNLKMAS